MFGMTYRDEIHSSTRPDGGEILAAREEHRSKLSRVLTLVMEEVIDCIYLASPDSVFRLAVRQVEWDHTEASRERPSRSDVAVHGDRSHFTLSESEQEAFPARTVTIADSVRFVPGSS